MRAIPGRAVTQSTAAIRCVAPGAPLRRCASSVSTAIPWRYDPSDFLFSDGALALAQSPSQKAITQRMCRCSRWDAICVRIADHRHGRMRGEKGARRLQCQTAEAPHCERRSKSALFCRHHLGDGECRSISGRPVQPVGPMVANDGWAGEPLSRPIAAEGGGRRPAFTVAASPAKLASRVDRLLAGIIRHAIVLDEVSACGTLNLCPI